MRLSRRRFLEIGAALAGAAAIPGCTTARKGIQGRIVDDNVAVGHRLRTPAGPASRGAPQKPSVLIVGGGVAGLSAAWRLRRAGIEDLAIIDLGETLGGTATGGVMDGMKHPWGAHYLPVPQASQRALVAFLQDMGLVEGTHASGRCRVASHHLVRAPQERLFHAGYWQEGLWLETSSGPDHHEDMARFSSALRAASTAGGSHAWCLPVASCSPSTRGLDGITATRWAQDQGLLSDRMRWYLEYAVRDDYGCSLDQASAWSLIHYFCSRLIPGTEDDAEYMTWPEGNLFLIDRLQDGLADRIQTRQLATSVRNVDGGVEVLAFDARAGSVSQFTAEHVVLAIPQFVVGRILQNDAHARDRARFRYAPWVVCNLHLRKRPESRGFERSWDNVLYASDSLGYVDAGHQVDRLSGETVWTWYLAVTDADEDKARRSILEAPWEHWRDLVIADLRRAHPDIEDCVTRIDVHRWGHAMIKPVPGFVWGPGRQRAARPQGRVHLAHTDLGGLPLFEEAHWAGTRAAEEILGARGMRYESLL